MLTGYIVGTIGVLALIANAIGSDKIRSKRLRSLASFGVFAYFLTAVILYPNETINSALITFAICAALFLLVLGWLCFRNRMLLFELIFTSKIRDLAKAERLHKKGDIDGAIEVLQTHIAKHGPSAMVNVNLSTYLGAKSNWAETLRLLEEAEQQQDASRILPLVLNNKAIALTRLKREREAELLYEEARRQFPINVMLICNHGELLITLGRQAEAVGLLAVAQAVFESSGSKEAKNRAFQEQLLAKLREKLATQPGSESLPAG